LFITELAAAIEQKLMAASMLIQKIVLELAELSALGRSISARSTGGMPYLQVTLEMSKVRPDPVCAASYTGNVKCKA